MAAKKKRPSARAKKRGLALIPTGSTKVLMFTASWCAPCQTLKKYLAKHPQLEALIEYVDLDAEPERAAKLKVDSVPTLMRPDGARYTGLGPIPEVRAFIEGSS